MHCELRLDIYFFMSQKLEYVDLMRIKSMQTLILETLFS